MKVFVYNKHDSRKIAELKHVTGVVHDKANHRIVFISDEAKYEFDTRLVKTTAYQN